MGTVRACQLEFSRCPERVLVKETAAGPVYAWPGLELRELEVNLRLLRTREIARAASIQGFRRLAETALQKDLAWLQKICAQSLASSRCSPACLG